MTQPFNKLVMSFRKTKTTSRWLQHSFKNVHPQWQIQESKEHHHKNSDSYENKGSSLEELVWLIHPLGAFITMNLPNPVQPEKAGYCRDDTTWRSTFILDNITDSSIFSNLNELWCYPRPFLSSSLCFLT